MNYFKAALVVLVGYGLLVTAIYKISEKNTGAVTFLWGCFLVIFGILGPLLIHLFQLPQDPARLDFFRDSFLIVAAIGANFIASACINSKRQEKLTPWSLRRRSPKVSGSDQRRLTPPVDYEDTG